MDKQKQDTLTQYLEFRALKNHSKNGMEDIEHHISKFINHSDKPLDEFNERMLIDYVNKVNQEYKINTANTIKSSFLKNFLKWYFEDWSARFRNINVVCKTEIPDPTYDDKDMLTEEDVKKLVAEEDSTFWKAYFLTLFYGGCRPIEVCNLKWESIEWENDGCFFTIYSKKNKKNFLKFVPSDVSFYLEKLKDNGSEYVFFNTKNNKPITRRGAYWKLRQMSERVLGKKINLYILRHSIATINYGKIGKDNGIEELDVARQMGHSKSMRNTYEHKDRTHIKENAKKIYFKPDDLPKEKKAELEKRIEEQAEQLEKMNSKYDKLVEMIEAQAKDNFQTHLEELKKLSPGDLKKRQEDFKKRGLSK